MLLHTQMLFVPSNEINVINAYFNKLVNNQHIITLYNYTTITQQTKLRVTSVALVVSSVSSHAVRQARHSQNAGARHVERVESCRVET